MITKNDIHPDDHTIPGCPWWSFILKLTTIQLAFYELRFPWFAPSELRKYAVEMHVFLCGWIIGRDSRNPAWQPEFCTFLPFRAKQRQQH